MSRILVTPEMLLQVAKQCSNAHEQLETMIHMLNKNIHMLESGWEGTTCSRFYADFQKAHREMVQTTEHIQRIGLELKAIAQRFKSADERGQPIQVAGQVLGSVPLMRGPGHRAVEDAGRQVEEAWNAVRQEAGKVGDTVKKEAGELWEGVKSGGVQLGNSLKDTAISLYEDPLGTGKKMLYNATIGTVEDIHDTAVWAGRMLFSNEHREKLAEDVKLEVVSAGGWSNYLGQGAALILGEALLSRVGIKGSGPLNNKHDDRGGGNSGGSGNGRGNGSGDGGGERGGDGDGKKSGDEGTGDVGDDFVGTLKGEKVHLKNVKTKEIIYTKRSPEDTAKLRREFDSTVRKGFLKGFANDPNKVEQLRKAGLTDIDIARMKDSLVPKGWQVHHKLPLDDGGTNALDNLVLIKNDPYHKAITNAQNDLTRGLEPGQNKTINWPIPDGDIYPPLKDW